MSAFDILYEDGPCLVICKHAGVLTQAPPGIDSLEVQVKEFLRQRGGGEDVYLGLPHRLDRPASGVMILATDYNTTRRLGRQFERRKVQKVYWACIEGQIQPEAGTWEDFVYKIPGQARAEVVAADHPGARTAVLHYRTMATAGWGTMLEIHAGDRTDAPDSRASCFPRTPAAGRCPVRLDCAAGLAARGRAAAADRPARPQPDLYAPDEPTDDYRDGPDAGILATIWTSNS